MADDQTRYRLPYDRRCGQHNGSALEADGQVLCLAMAIGVFGVGRRRREAETPEHEANCRHVNDRFQCVRQNGGRASQQVRPHFESQHHQTGEQAEHGGTGTQTLIGHGRECGEFSNGESPGGWAGPSQDSATAIDPANDDQKVRARFLSLLSLSCFSFLFCSPFLHWIVRLPVSAGLRNAYRTFDPSWQPAFRPLTGLSPTLVLIASSHFCCNG